jgi:hypothetical protein
MRHQNVRAQLDLHDPTHHAVGRSDIEIDGRHVLFDFQRSGLAPLREDPYRVAACSQYRSSVSKRRYPNGWGSRQSSFANQVVRLKAGHRSG